MQDVRNYVQDQLSKYIKLDENQEIGIAGFTLFATVRQNSLKSVSVPTIPLEDGSYITDHVIQNAFVVELTGRVSEEFFSMSPIQDLYTRGLAEIGNVDRFFPNRTRQQINQANEIIVDAKNIYEAAADYVNTGAQLYNLFASTNEEKSIPEKFIDVIESLMNSNTSIPIDFGHRTYENMLISSFEVITSPNIGNAVDFRLTAVQLQYLQTLVEDVSKYFKNPSSSVQDQVAGSTNKGVAKKETVESSTWYDLQYGTPE